MNFIKDAIAMIDPSSKRLGSKHAACLCADVGGGEEMKRKESPMKDAMKENPTKEAMKEKFCFLFNEEGGSSAVS